MIISRSTQNYKLFHFTISRSAQNYKLFHFMISRSWVVTPPGWSRHFRNLWDLWISWTVALRTLNPWSTSHLCMPTLCVSRLGNWTGKRNLCLSFVVFVALAAFSILFVFALAVCSECISVDSSIN